MNPVVVPKELLCPITQELLVDPVLAEDGHTYEREAITRWFGTGNTRSPVTNEELEGKQVLPNHVLRKLVLQHRSYLGEQLLLACEGDDDSQVVDLLDKGADVNSRKDTGDTALLILISRGRLNLAKQLVELGADASVANDMGETPSAAVRRRRLDQSFVDFIDEAGKAAEIHRLQVAENRNRARDEYRRTQELRRTGDDQVRMGPANASVINSELVQGVGFFPSLFGLQFQGSIIGNGGEIQNTTTSTLPLSQRIVNWARMGIAGDPDFLPGEDDLVHQQFLSRVLLSVGSLVLLCLLLL